MNEPQLTSALRRAMSFENEGKFFEAEILFRQLIQAKPDYPMAHFMYGTFKLLKGEYAEAWPYVQRRLEDEFYTRKGTMKLPKPFWNGRKQPKKTLLVHIDQGIGDAIMCARYIPAAADRVKQLIFAVHRRMGRFFSRIDPRIRMAEIGDPVPEFDVHIDLFSLLPIFGAVPGKIPGPPYLTVEPEVAAKWKKRLAGPEFRVGLAWQGTPVHPRDEERSMKLKELEPLMRTPGAKFYGLQIGAGAEQAKEVPSDIAFESLEPDLADAAANMVDTAGAVANFDLVISVDSAVAHLSAAMGVPTWVPTYNVPDWRWQYIAQVDPLRWENAPWYPKARIFRKTIRYDWTEPVARMTALLADDVAKKRT